MILSAFFGPNNLWMTLSESFLSERYFLREIFNEKPRLPKLRLCLIESFRNFSSGI